MPYTRLGLYRDAGDRRLFVPKRDPRFGWTVNLAHPAAAPLLFALGAVVVATLLAGLATG